jgi:exodeoxyribonuclease V alpha subunit
VRLALASKALVITGGPGVGKTTLVNSVLRSWRPKGPGSRSARPPAARPSAWPRAPGARRPPIHRLLEADPKEGGFKRGEQNPVDCDLLVVDETSMVDVPLMRALLRACPRARRCCWWATWTSCPRSGRGRCWPT